MNVKKLRMLTAAEWWLLLTSAALVPAYWAVVRSGLYSARSWPFQAMAGDRSQSSVHAARRMGALVNTAARYAPWPATCLVRSLVLIAQLRRRGIHGNLRIGVRMCDGALKAHAWVEHGGVPVNDALDISLEFAVIDTDLGYGALARA